MKSYKVESGGIERRILLSMILSDAVVGRIASRWEEPDGLFPNRASNTIAKMCVDHFNRYNCAPGPDIVVLAKSWAKGREGDLVDEVDDFLRAINHEFESDNKINSDLMIDQAGDFFTSVRLEKAFEAGKGFLLKGQVSKAVALLNDCKPVEMGEGSFIDPFTDDEFVDSMMREKRESIIKYEGGLGKFFGLCFRRESLVAIQASAKSAKSYHLLDIAMTALKQKLTVAFFECGDLTQNQVSERMMTKIAGRPLRLEEGQKSLIYKVPISLNMIDGQPKVGYEEMEITSSLSAKKIKKLREQFRDEYKADKRWRLSIHASRSLSMPDMRSILHRWGREEFFPDLIVIDYIDLIKPMNGKLESRDQINETWLAASNMRQELKSVVLVATQADAGSYKTDLIRRTNFSGDRRKNDHVTAMYALNHTDGEKEKGIQRLNWLDKRDEAYSEREVAYIVGCLDIASPCLLSHFRGD